MADLDSLSIVLRASSKDAVDAVDAIQDALKRLNGALENFSYSSKYMRGLETLSAGLKSIRISLNGLDAKKIEAVSKALDKLCTATEKLSGLTSFAPAVDTKSTTKIVAASQKAIADAQKIGKEFKFEGEDQVNDLAEAIERLYASVGDDNAVRKAMEDIDNLVLAYGRYENELHETAKAQNDVARSSHTKLSKDWVDVMGGDYETARKNRAFMGIRNTSKEGGSTADIVNENQILGLQELANEGENAAQVLDLMKQNAYNATHELVDFSKASETITGGMEGIQSVANELVNSLGLVAEKIREVKTASAGDDLLGAADDDDFVDIFSDPAEAVERLRNSAQQAAPAVEQLNTAEENVVTHTPQLEQVENIFLGISTALQSLQGITLSDSLKNIEYISGALGKFGGQYAAPAADNIRNVAEALRGFDVQIPNMGDELTVFANGLAQLGKKKVTDGFTNLINLKVGLEGFNTLKIDPTVTASIQQLGDGLYRFGLAKMDKAVSNIPQLATNLSQLITSLSNLPAVGESTIRLVEALGNMNVNASTLGRSMGNIGTGMKRYTGHAISARKASMSLAQAFGKMYANFFIFFRLARRFKSDIDLASDLTEVQNVVDVAFADMTEKMNAFSKSAIDALGMGELTAKQIGSKYQAMGSAMGISDAMVKSTNDFVQKATSGYADVADSMADVSINITRLAGDMASFYNQDYADVAEKLQAIFTGQTRPLRAFGIDLTQATLAEWAMRNGMEANIKTMTQAEKTLLRYQYVMAQTTAAHGDFIRTQNTWANQIRIATEKLNQLRIVLGKIAIYTFKPLVQNFNKAMDQILKGAEGLLNALGKIFGWQVEWSDAGIIDDEAEDAEDLADNMGDAADNAKKFKNFLLGIDELNLLPDNSDKDKGGAGGIGDLSGDLGELGKFNVKPIERGFESLYDTLYKLGKRINEILKGILQSIDWDKVYKKARRFGRGLAEFLNGFLSDAETFYEIGKFFAGGINTVANAIDAYQREFNGFQKGVDIGNIINGFTENLDWAVIKSAAYEWAHDIAQTINGALLTTDWRMVGSTLAEALNTAVIYFHTLGSEINWGLLGDSIAEGINGFFSTFDIGRVAETINAWAEGILDALYNALDKTDWSKVGKKIGEFLRKLNVTKIASGLSKVFIKALGAAADILSSSLAAAPLETILLGAIAFIKPQTIGTAFNSLFKSAFNFVDSKALSSAISGLISNLPKSLSTYTLALGAGLTEFAALKNIFRDIAAGTETVNGAIFKMGTTTLATGAILTALFGPAGALATGLIGVAGGFTGAMQSLIELQAEADKISFANMLSNGGVGVGEYFESAANNMRTAYENYGKMAREIEKTDFSELKGNIKTDMEEIGLAIETLGTNLGDTSKTVEEKLADLEKLFENFKNDISSLFAGEISVIEQAAMNGIIDNGAQALAAAHNLDLGVQKQIDAIKAKMDEATRLFQENGKNGVMTYSYEEYEKIMMGYWNEMNAIYAATADNGMKKIAETASTIDFSKFFMGEENIDSIQANLEAFGVVYQDAINDMQTSYDGLYEALTSLGQQSEALGDKPAALEFAKLIQNAQAKELSAIEEANTDYISKIEDLETQAWEQIALIMSNPDHLSPTDVSDQLYRFVNDYYAPVEDAIIKETERVGIAWSSEMKDLAFQLVDESNAVLSGNALDGRVYDTLFDLWTDRFSEAAGKAKYEITGLSNTESVAQKSALEFAKSQGILSKALEATNKSAAESEKTGKTTAYGYGNVNRAMQDVTASAGLLTSGVIDFNSVLKETTKDGEKVKDISTGFSSLNTVLGNVGTALAPVKTGFLEFTTQAQTNMMNMSQIFNQAFGSITKYGNQTISWMKSSFIPYFSGSYWSSITASIPNAFGNAFRQAINIMVNLWKQFAQWANENMKINAQVAKNGNGAKAEVKIPQYSTGGFPEDGLFQANHGELVGKFANGQTAVANNEQIVEGIRQGVYEAVSAAMAGGQGVTVELVGDTANLFTAVVKENNRAIMRTGNSPLRR